MGKDKYIEKETWNYKDINKKLDNFVFDGNPIFDGDFCFEEMLADRIIPVISKYIPYHVDIIYKNRVCDVKALTYAEEVIASLPKKYQDLYRKCIEENEITFDEDINSYFNTATHVLNVGEEYTLEDVSSFIHEFMHFTNLDEDNDEYLNTINYYTESMSSFMELYTCDYLAKTYPNFKKETQRIKRSVFRGLFEALLKAKVLFFLLKEKFDGKVISSYSTVQIVKYLINYLDTPEEIVAAIKEIYEDIMDDVDIIYEQYCSYIVAAGFSTVLYNLYKEKGIEYAIEFNDAIQQLNILEAMSCIDVLDIDCFCELSDKDMEIRKVEALDEIEKQLIKEMKKLW